MSEIEYRDLAAKAAQDGRPDQSARWLGRLFELAPTAANAGFVNRSFAELAPLLQLPPVKIALLRSFTLEPLVPLVQARCFLAGLNADWLVGGFNAFAQEILDAGSELYRYDPDVIFLAVRGADVMPALTRDAASLDGAAREASAAAAVAHVRKLVAAIRSRTSAAVVIHNFEQPSYASMGVLDGQAAFGQREAIAAVNSGVSATAREHIGVYVLDYSELMARSGRLGWADDYKRLTIGLPLSSESLNLLADEYMRFLRPLSGKVCKAIAVDFDNTLWGGVVGEDGIEGIRLGPEYPGVAYLELQRVLLDLQARGVLICACSKNNRAEGMAVLEQHPAMLLRAEHFAAMEINWDDKVENLRRIAASLNIGLDAIAFLDDNPIEREWVREQLPEVHVIELPRDAVGYASAVRRSPMFERLSLSEEDRARTRQYAEQRQRAAHGAEAGSLEEFLASLGMVAIFRDLDPQTLARVSQLTLKTNQFNLTTRRYPEAELAGLAQDPAITVRSIQVQDRFGDNGIVGVMITRASRDAWEIDTFLLSCRVIGRTVETAMLADACARARSAGARWLEGQYIPTAKNAPAKDCYERHGFAPAGERDGATLWRFDLQGNAIETPRWIAGRVMEGGARV